MNDPILRYLSALASLTTGPLYLVGGTLRDLLSGISDPRDIDLMMPSGSEDAARRFAADIDGSFFFLDEERRITRVVKEEAGCPFQFDFANFEGPDLAADLGRRDFTINAMALDLREYLRTGSIDGIIDLFGGREDVRRKLIRVDDPKVLEDDPLRLLRAARFAATLGFSVDPLTADRIRKRAALVTKPSPERLRDELFLIFAERNAEQHLLLLDALGLLGPLFPELEALRGFAPGRYHVHDVLTHSLKTAGYLDSVLDDLPRAAPQHAAAVLAHLEEPLEHGVPRKAALRFACLLHDAAKPATFTDEDGRIRFHGHDTQGGDTAAAVCRRLRLSRSSETLIAKVIRHHMRLFNLTTQNGPSRNALYRYCRDMADGLPESLLLAQADARATAEIMPKDSFADTGRSMLLVLDYYYAKFLKVEAAPFLSGDDLIGLGLAPGPRFREVLDDIRERQADGSLRSREDAFAYLRLQYSSRGPDEQRGGA